jgi:predicted nucleic acid-binding protein
MVFLDANILLEYIESRPKQDSVREFLTQNRRHRIALSVLSAHLVLHFGKNSITVQEIYDVLDGYEVEDLSWADFSEAKRIMRNSDLEDAVQLACAIRHGADEFVTLDKKLARDYKDFAPITVKLLT